MVHVAVFETIFGARYGGTSAWIRPEQLSEVLAPLAPIPGTTWRWPSPGHQLYAGDGLLALAGPNHGPEETPETAEYREVFIAGRDRSAVQHLVGIDGVEWDWASWRDEAASGN
jgi:hypothetical protein